MKCLSFLAAFALLSPLAASAGGVAVGSSSLISTIQYSDSYTIGTDYTTGTRNGETYNVGGFPLTTQEAIVESAYAGGHTTPTFSTNAFSLNNDAHYIDATTNGSPFFQTYPGGSGAGSASGFTQTGLDHSAGHIPLETDFGIAYGLSNNFIVQFDAVQLSDRIDINIGNQNNSIAAPDGLSLFIRGTDNGASVGLWNVNLEEKTTSFTSTAAGNAWNNYAVRFDLTDKLISVYTNQTLLGTINLNTFDGGAYAAVLDSNSNEFVGLGGHETDPTAGQNGIGLLWTDNFQVGLVPEPSTYAMLLGGVVLLLGIQRFRRLRS